MTRAPMRSSTPRLSSSRGRPARQVVAERRQRLLAAVEQQHPHRCRVDRAEVLLRGSARQLADLAGELAAGRTGADDDDRQPRRPLVGVGRGLRHLERAEHAPADLDGVVERLHARGVQRELVVTEVRLAGAGGDDQAVVGHRDLFARSPHGVHDAPLEVEAGDLDELDAYVAGSPQHVA